jgi:acyl-CoA hydrolase
MDYMQEYKSKLRTPDEAVKCVKDGDWVDYTGSCGFPVKLDEALSRRRDELHHVRLQGNLVFGPVAAVEADPEQEHFVYNTWHCSGYERKLCDRGLGFFTPMIFRNQSWYYKNFIHVNVAMVTVAPMDSHGYFSLGCVVGSCKFILDQADVVILEVNEHAPRIRGGLDDAIHISEADMVVESGLPSYPSVPAAAPKAEDVAIASYIMPQLVDGATIQLGIGSVPNALGEQIAKSDLRDLGMHTELCSDAYLSLFREGKLTNARKAINRGKGVLGLAFGSSELYDWLSDNAGVAAFPLSYVNDPYVISQHDNMVSINGCVSADLYGQVCSESSGTRQISGTGGQLDFLTGAAMSKGGKAFLCMTSAFTDKAGVKHSRIVPTFSGDIVTSPRSQAYYIVTEYGCVNLAGKSTWERAEALISIAHPDFRDELVKAAEAQRIWLPENKR